MPTFLDEHQTHIVSALMHTKSYSYFQNERKKDFFNLQNNKKWEDGSQNIDLVLLYQHHIV